MGLLNFSPAKCVRALSINSVCISCADACPVMAIDIAGRLPSINQSMCVGCSACVANCPTEALELDDFNPTEFFFSFAADSEKIISCQKNVPCIAAIGSEHLIALAALKGGVELDIGHCAECSIGTKILETVEQRVEDASYLLEAIGSDAQILCNALAYTNENDPQEYKDRRDFFKTFHLKGIAKVRNDFEKQVQKATDEFVEYSISNSHVGDLRAKKITDRRKIFFTALKRVQKPDVYHVVDASKIAFTSQKLMDEAKCSACELCYRICPSGALSSDMRNSKIDFDPFLCIKCHLCHDVCESDAITLSESYNLKEWFEPKVQNLVTFLVRRCDECDGLFSSVGGEKICRRCRLEEEEARELWGI